MNRGSGLLGRFANFFPEYFSSLVFVSVPYLPGKFDVGRFLVISDTCYIIGLSGVQMPTTN